jgi:peptidylprolyl isomerase
MQRKQMAAKYKKKVNSSDESDEEDVHPLAGLTVEDHLPPPYQPHKKPGNKTIVGVRGENPVIWMEVKSFGGGRGRGGGKTVPRNLGKLHFELRNDLVPVACANFLQLITGKLGWGSDGVNYHYKNSRIHRICKGVVWSAGDLLDQKGNCSRSTYNKGGLFKDENFIFRHTGPGCLSMCNRGPDTNGSLFQVSMTTLPEFDEKYVVFGCLADDESYQTLGKINTFGTDHGAPTEEVRITDCGIAYPFPRTPEEIEAAAQRLAQEEEDKRHEKHQASELSKKKQLGFA